MRELSALAIVRELLNTYTLALDTLQRGESAGRVAPTSKHLAMTELWKQGSYRDLEDGLRVMRDAEPVMYWHVAETYVRAPTRIVMGCPECRVETSERHSHKVKGKTLRLWPQRISVRVVSKTVNPTLVRYGEEALVRWFRDNGRALSLPREVFSTLAA